MIDIQKFAFITALNKARNEHQKNLHTDKDDKIV
jgi:hypothetical protein